MPLHPRKHKCMTTVTLCIQRSPCTLSSLPHKISHPRFRRFSNSRCNNNRNSSYYRSHNNKIRLPTIISSSKMLMASNSSKIITNSPQRLPFMKTLPSSSNSSSSFSINLNTATCTSYSRTSMICKSLPLTSGEQPQQKIPTNQLFLQPLIRTVIIRDNNSITSINISNSR